MRKGPLAFLIALFISLPLFAQELRIPIPKRSHPTPVQALNRDGVKLVEKHEYDKAKKLFYKAYLLDPNDPFTLNNLGYMAELDGDLDRAQRYYGLASDLSSEAVVDKSTNDLAEGKPVAEVAGNAENRNLQVNRLNIEAMGLLMKDRAPEADLVLQKALKVDPKDPFTLNNMGFAKEKEGEMQAALSYYTASAATRSQEKIVVAPERDWRGKSITEIADRNAKKVRKDLDSLNGDLERQVASLNLRGVSALNRNDTELARKLFERAYTLDPQNAFAINNMGYIAELQGDRETAEFYYAKAREAEHAGETVKMASRKDAEGHKVADVAQTSDQKVQDAMAATVEARRRSGEAVALRRRDGEIVKPIELPASDTTPVRPNTPEPPETSEPTPPSQPKLLMPLENQPAGAGAPANAAPPNAAPPANATPSNRPPANAQPPSQPSAQPNAQPGDVIPPLPDSKQPPNADKPSDVIPPLPDSKQPPNADKAQPPANQPPPPNNAQPGASDVIPPLPDSQQPQNADKTKPPQNAQPPQSQQQQPGAMDVIPPLPDNQQPQNADKAQPGSQQKPPQKPPR